MQKMQFRNWRELPFKRIFVDDSEFYPGKGLANGGREGDLPTPLCNSAIELRTKTRYRWRQGRPYPPELAQLGPDDLYVSYLLTAEYSQRRAHGLGRPPNAIDAYVEFRRLATTRGCDPAIGRRAFTRLRGLSSTWERTKSTSRTRRMRAS